MRGPLEGSRREPSSEAETTRGPRGAWMGRTVSVGRVFGLLEPFSFFQIGRRPWAFVGPVALTCVCVLWSGLSTPIRVSLIVVPAKFIIKWTKV